MYGSFLRELLKGELPLDTKEKFCRQTLIRTILSEIRIIFYRYNGMSTGNTGSRDQRTSQ